MPKSASPSAYKPRRGRPDASRVVAIDRAILSAARRFFLDEGYDATAMETIASAAGVSKATLYARHPTKSDLFRAVVQESVAQWSEMSDQHHLPEGQTLRERLMHHGTLIARSLPNPEVHAFQRLLISTRERFPELSLAMYESGSRPIVDRIARDIADATARDGQPARDPEMIARLFLSAMTGWALQEGAARKMTDSELEEVARRIIDLFLLARDGW
ncbi:TetR/AcrR family transcriptional regulator [Sphingobium sp.]|uniref:TetR/AcrR family transcriptional regulator n=1 Tax=Sphingobium sp. TaxID=1912891 RepID=UPI002BDC5779|nr:TetR/AcrR family transcriptional regulator [Sphingobium sp.]HUD93959.1 TetR/AcrR family transcriptional regulator [Sphingobium sp.]